MILKCEQTDFKEICDIINDAAIAYKDIIPADRWHDPYMPEEELDKQINEGVQFWCWKEDGETMGVMGIQDKGKVMLIRHAYVRSIYRNKGIGSKLLAHLVSIASTPVLVGTWAAATWAIEFYKLVSIASTPVLVGTWAAATWAIEFYKKHGFRLLSASETETLLRKYWSIPDRQVETSVVLASPDWS